MPQCAGRSKRTGEQCRRNAIKGGTVCPMHGGSAPQVKAKAARTLERIKAETVLARLGVPLETDPIPALEQSLWEAAGNTAVLRALVGDLPTPLDIEHGPQGSHRQVHHPLVTLYNEERDRLAKLAETCVKLGLDERRVQLAEAQVNRLFAAVTAALVGVPAEYADLFRRQLAAELRKPPGVS